MSLQEAVSNSTARRRCVDGEAIEVCDTAGRIAITDGKKLVLIQSYVNDK